MYKYCYDEKHSFIEFNASRNSHNKRRRKGIYERLLCIDCEGILQKYEDYGKTILYDEVKPFIKQKRKAYYTTEYDYKKFKLFSLSLLWRASICNLSMFNLINLGPYEETLRDILFYEKLIQVNEFPCFIWQLQNGPSLADGVFMEIFPTKAKKDRKTVYHLIIDGLYFFFGVGLCSIQTFRNGSSICPESLRIGVDDLVRVDAFLDIFNRIKRQGKFSEYEKQEHLRVNQNMRNEK